MNVTEQMVEAEGLVKRLMDLVNERRSAPSEYDGDVTDLIYDAAKAMEAAAALSQAEGAQPNARQVDKALDCMRWTDEDGKNMRMASSGQIVEATGENETIANRLADMAEDPSFDHLTRMIAGQASRDIKRLQNKLAEALPTRPREQATALCEDCPPVGYPTDKTRCEPCPRTRPREQEGADLLQFIDLERDQHILHGRAWAAKACESITAYILAHPLPPASFQAGAEAMREAAAKKARACHLSWYCEPHELTEYGKENRRVCENIEAAIRALPLPIPASSEGR